VVPMKFLRDVEEKSEDIKLLWSLIRIEEMYAFDADCTARGIGKEKNILGMIGRARYWAFWARKI
jgi:hypothetical protein